MRLEYDPTVMNCWLLPRDFRAWWRHYYKKLRQNIKRLYPHRKLSWEVFHDIDEGKIYITVRAIK